MAEEGQVIAIHSPEAWTEHMDSAITSKKLVVVDFTASWYGPCRLMAPHFAMLSKKLTNVVFLVVDVDHQKSIAEEYGVDAMPTFLIMKEGKVLDKIVGANQKLEEKITQHLATASA